MATSQTKTPPPAAKAALYLPFKPMPAGYDERIMNVEAMTIRLGQKHRLKLRAIINGLIAQHAQLENGEHVENQTQAIRWLMENISLAE